MRQWVIDKLLAQTPPKMGSVHVMSHPVYVSVTGALFYDDAHVGAPFNAPFSSTRNRFTPGVQFLIHANIKATFEYQFRPSQTVVIATDPITGFPVALNPFHTNTAVVGLEFVY